MKPLVWMLSALCVTGCLPTSESDEEGNEGPCSKSSQLRSCQSTEDDPDSIEDPGPLVLTKVTATPTGIISDSNEEALIEAGLSGPPFVYLMSFYHALYLEVETESGVINCQSGSGRVESFESDSDGGGFLDLITYTVTRQVYEDCLSPRIEPLGTALFDGVLISETRLRGLSSLVTKYSATDFSITLENELDGSTSTVGSAGSWLSSYSLNTKINSIEFDYLTKDSSETGMGTFRIHSLKPSQRDDGQLISGEWTLEDANGSIIHFVVTGSQDETVSVTSRGVAMGDYEP